jgi:Ni,Fe-hydrogenase I large subunit
MGVGFYEAPRGALGHWVKIKDKKIVVRVIRSFDPCLACAVHLIDPKTNEIKKFIVE